MAVSQQFCRVEGHIGMDITTTKLIRGTLFTLVMGVVTIYGIDQTSGFIPVIVVSYILAALLVFGIDIERISLGDRFEIIFETDQRQQNDSD